MQKKSCAVLDFGSSKITAVIGERGVNKTFIIIMMVIRCLSV